MLLQHARRSIREFPRHLEMQTTAGCCIGGLAQYGLAVECHRGASDSLCRCEAIRDFGLPRMTHIHAGVCPERKVMRM